MNENDPLIENINTKKKVGIGFKNQPLNIDNHQLGKMLQCSYQWLDTGYPELNSLLNTGEDTSHTSGGWPLGTTTEVCLAEPGIGELRLFIPALRTLIKRNSALQNVILINPPYVPYAPALKKSQVDLDCLTVINTNNKTDVLWATEQALSAKCCAAVLTWTSTHPLSQKEARRLQLAAEKSGTMHVLFRHQKYLKQSSPFRLRVALTPQPHAKLQLNIVKQPLSWGGQKCVLSLAPHYEHWQRMRISGRPVSKFFDQVSSTRVKVLAKAKHANNALPFSAKQLVLPKVS